MQVGCFVSKPSSGRCRLIGAVIQPVNMHFPALEQFRVGCDVLLGDRGSRPVAPGSDEVQRVRLQTSGNQ